MPWHIEDNHPGCLGYAVVKDEDGELEGCHRTRAQAEDHLAALNIVEANEIEDEDDDMEDDYRAEGYAPSGAMIEEAKRGLAWRQEFGRGGTQIGVSRARDISNGRALSIDTIQRMVSYFARHEIDKDGEGFSPGEDGYPSAGRIAWALWGGDPGRAWAERILNEEERALGEIDDLVDHADQMTNRALVEQILARVRRPR